jgi:hypothetical protein
MKKSKWYNWTGDSMWDDYCLHAWIFILIPCFIFLGFCVYLIATGRVTA